MRRTSSHWIAMFAVLTLALVSAGCPKTPPSPPASPSPTPVPTEMGVVVNLVEHTGTDPEKPELRAAAGPDHIRWSNPTSVDRKIHFTVDWPFMETSGDITVAP